MRLFVLLLAACVLAMPTSAQAYWTYLNIDNAAPNSSTARPNFNYARACKTAMNLSGVGPVFRVRLNVERNPQISTGSLIRIYVNDGAYGSIINSRTNDSWYGAWSTVEAYAPIFADITFSFTIADRTKGFLQIGRHATPAGYRYRYRGDELPNC